MDRFKVIKAETKVEDEAEGLIRAVVSDESVDRDGDIIRQRHWTLDAFNRHPVLLSSHNYSSLRSQIGTWETMEVKGAKLMGLARYFVGQGNPEADWGFHLAQRGVAAFSVGFTPDMDKARPIEAGKPGKGLEFRGQELLEVSQVVVPSNSNALQRMKGMELTEPIKGIVDSILADQGVLSVDNAIDPDWTTIPDLTVVDGITDKVWEGIEERLDKRLSGEPIVPDDVFDLILENLQLRLAQYLDAVSQPSQVEPKSISELIGGGKTRG